MDLKAIKKVHFIGIGGIGISAIARMMLGEGKAISGSDQAPSLVTDELVSLGAQISFSQSATNIPTDVELVVYTIAIADDNPELIEAKKRQIPILTYPQILGLISADKFTIAISGTHGKTTTTAMIAKIFLDAGLDPTVIVGSFLLDSSSGRRTNFIAGQSKPDRPSYLIVEACEYRRSFLNLSPKILVITNIDNDHLDYYKNLEEIKGAFAELVAKLPADGVLITEKEYTQIPADFVLKVPGDHNVRNAQAALAVAEAVGINQEVAKRSLSQFAGTWRRFEFKGKIKSGARVYDDYGHHPTEVRATLQAAKSLLAGPGKLIVAFQPHLYSRTKLLFSDFVSSLSLADRVLILPIYAAREPLDLTIASGQLAEALKSAGTNAEAVDTFAEAAAKISELASSTDIVVTLGAGDISQLANNLV